jgi:hypothetical protein
LKQFSNDENGNLFYLKLHSPYSENVKPTNASKICYIPNFHIINDYTNHFYQLNNKNFIEKKCFPYEKELQNVLEIFTQNQYTLSRDIANKLIYFMFHMKYRNPSYRELLAHGFKNNTEKVEKNIEELAEKLKNLPKTFLEQHFSDTNIQKSLTNEYNKWLSDANNLNEIHKRGLLDIFNNDNNVFKSVCNFFNGLTLFVSKAPNNEYFITSDNPGYFVDKQERVCNFGIDNADSFHFPLSHKYLLSFILEDKEPSLTIFKNVKEMKTTKDFVHLLNIGTALNARENIFSNNKATLEQLKIDLKLKNICK